MATPGSYDLRIYRGDSDAWTFTFYDGAELTPVDLTDVEVKAEIRARPGSAVLLELDCAVTLPNIVDITLSTVDSESLVPGQAVWDLQLTYLSGDVRTIVRGAVIVTADVTDSDGVAAMAGRRR